jgi:hypothetical protein
MKATCSASTIRRYADRIATRQERYIHGPVYYEVCRLLREDPVTPGLFYDYEGGRAVTRTRGERLITLALALTLKRTSHEWRSV